MTTLPTHPRTGLRALGITRRGPVWPALGGDDTGAGSDGQGGTAGAGTGQQGDGGQSSGQQQSQGQQGDSGQQGGQEPPLGPDGQPWDADRASRLVANLRQEIAALKGKQANGGQQQGQEPAQQQQEPQQQAGQAPADDTAEQLHTANTKLAIFEHAGKHGANPTALTDSLSFMDKVAKLDPTSDDYSTKLGEAIKKAVTDHPHYATGQAPGTSPRGGSDGTGRPGAPNRPRGLTGAVSAHYAKK